MKKFLDRYIFNTMSFRLLLLIACVAICTYFGMKKEGLFFVLFAVLTLIAFIKARALHKRNIQKIEYMFDAIDNNDLSFQFAIDHQSTDDRTVNELINRAIRTLLRTRIDTLKKEKFFEQIIDSIKIGIIAIDESGYIVQRNHKAMQLLGVSVLTHIKQIRHINDKLTEHLTNLQPDDKFSFSYDTERGTIDIYVQITVARLQNKKVFIITFSDINKEMEDKEIESWMRLIRVLTHEIMNSVTPITSISDTLLSKQQLHPEDAQNGLEVISKTGKGLISFVESYRKFTHIPEPQPSLFYLKGFIERMILLARHHKDDSHIQWKTDIQPADLILYADENLISLAMINLLKNAVQAIDKTCSDGQILIKAFCNETESVIVEISNNGATIPAEEASHIFIPFFTTKEAGSGIGLSVVRQIMRRSGGSITLKKEAHSDMTTFVLTFP